MSSSDPLLEQPGAPPLSDVLLGFDRETDLMLNELTMGTKELDVVAIFGMPGLGKTTMANKLFHHKTVINHFPFRAWCRVSQEYKKENLLNIIYQQLVRHDNKHDKDDVATKLQKYMKIHRCLIVLDDVWTTDAWDELSINFPKDGDGNRIIVTSRLEEVAQYAKQYSDPHKLPFLTKEQSWDLICKIVFKGETYQEANDLADTGKQIAEKCGGLPHSLALVGAVLGQKEKSSSSWIEVLDKLSTTIRDQNQGLDIVEFSYNHLDEHLKSCLLYFALFPDKYKDFEVLKLIQLWIAQGFVKNVVNKSSENAAEDQLNELIACSLIMGKKRYNGRISNCSLHDLVREFCQRKATEENRLLVVYDEADLKSIRTINPCWLYFYHENVQKCALKSSLQKGCKISSVMCSPSEGSSTSSVGILPWIYKNMEHLNMLDVGSVCMFAKDIRPLVHLKYLALRRTQILMPREIGKFRNLQTLTADYYGFSLNASLWDLVNLRHLQIPMCRLDLEASSNQILKKLQTLSRPHIRCREKDEDIMRRFPHLRSLICTADQLYDMEANVHRFPRLDFLSELEYLHISPMLYAATHPSQFNFPGNLKDLKLGEFRLPWSDISQVAKLPKLEGLELYRAFDGAEWKVEDKFAELKFLKVNCPSLQLWDSSSHFFPKLEQLVLERCEKLKEVPPSFVDVDTLKTIEVNWCNKSVVSSAMAIQEEVREMGYDGFKVIFQH